MEDDAIRWRFSIPDVIQCTWIGSEIIEVRGEKGRERERRERGRRRGEGELCESCVLFCTRWERFLRTWNR